MDEASELGDRIGIFIDGEIVSTGSLSALRAEYCKSYFVEIALQSTAPDDAQDKTFETFSSNGMPAEVYESLPYHFKLQVPFQSENRLEQLASLFELLESHRQELHIKFYSVAQMSLEQIFIDLSRRQFAAEESTRFL
jgi:ABC-type multidrug transport system ATPase subunit